jgi:putative endonuclease
MDNLHNKTTGNQGESLAINFLEKKGYEILTRNFLIKGGEIDIIAKDKDILVFVEVKARYSHKYGLPIESITYFKIKSLKKTALFYIQKIGWGFKPYRFDLVSIDYAQDRENPQIELIENII